MTTAHPAETHTSSAGSSGKSPRLHYLDWLQVLAILGVFIFHAVHPFDDLVDWHITNAERSILATFYTGFFNLWGMPFFFLMAGATSWFVGFLFAFSLIALPLFLWLNQDSGKRFVSSSARLAQWRGVY